MLRKNWTKLKCLRACAQYASQARCSSGSGPSFGWSASLVIAHFQQYFCGLSELTSDQQQLRDAIRKFTTEEILPVAAQYDKTMEFPWDVIKKAHACGFINPDIPSAYGTYLTFQVRSAFKT